MRECGDCIVCCVYLKIPELDKRGFEHCRHLSLDHDPVENELQFTGISDCGNCEIHKTKPSVCKNYSCLWLQGHGLEKDRPDKSFILADTLHNIENAIEIKQVKDGIANTKQGKATIERLARSTNQIALVATFYERSLIRAVGRPL